MYCGVSANGGVAYRSIMASNQYSGQYSGSVAISLSLNKLEKAAAQRRRMASACISAIIMAASAALEMALWRNTAA